jgi:hypothetical protein
MNQSQPHVDAIRELANDFYKSMRDGSCVIGSDERFYKPQSDEDGHLRKMTYCAKINIVIGQITTDRDTRLRLLSEIFSPGMPFKSSKEMFVAEAEALWKMRGIIQFIVEEVGGVFVERRI